MLYKTTIFQKLCHAEEILLRELQAFHKSWRKLPALPVPDHLNRQIMSECLLIDTFAHKRIVHIHNGDNLCADRDSLPLQMIRIAIAVIAFMVVPAYVITIAVKLIVILRRGWLSFQYRAVRTHE